MTTHVLADQVVATLEDWLSTEENSGSTQSLADLAACHIRRQHIDETLQAIEDTAARFRRRTSHLPSLPDTDVIQWAQAVRRFPNLAFLEVDTDGLSSDADILRVILLNVEGIPLYTQTVKPRRPLSDKIRHLTAIDPQEVADAPTLTQVWDDLKQALSGRYILSFNLPFDMGNLAENAERYHLPRVTLIGACLMEQAGRYFKQCTYPSLSALCMRIGHLLPDHPTQTACDRAKGQIALLTALSEGITNVPISAVIQHATLDEPERTGELEDDINDEHPF